MRYALLTDIHGRELSNFIDEMQEFDPDVLICLGDFDQVPTIHQYLDYKERLEAQGKTVITLPGNHDHCILNDIEMYSPTLSDQRKQYWELRDELRQDPRALEFISSLFEREREFPLRESIQLVPGVVGENFNTILMHGAIKGSCVDDVEEEVTDLWNRLEWVGHSYPNHRAMEQLGLDVMIRGHDHRPTYDTFLDREGKRYTPHPGDKFVLVGGMAHIITIGAYFDGWYATIDTQFQEKDLLILSYHNVDTGDNQ
jgi:predicted phosphodiesterase